MMIRRSIFLAMLSGATITCAQSTVEPKRVLPGPLPKTTVTSGVPASLTPANVAPANPTGASESSGSITPIKIKAPEEPKILTLTPQDLRPGSSPPPPPAPSAWTAAPAGTNHWNPPLAPTTSPWTPKPAPANNHWDTKPAAPSHNWK